MKWLLHSTGIEPRTGRSADQRCTHREPDSHEIHVHVVLKRLSLRFLVDVSKPKSQQQQKKNFFNPSFSLFYCLHQTAARVGFRQSNNLFNVKSSKCARQFNTHETTRRLNEPCHTMALTWMLLFTVMSFLFQRQNERKRKK